MTELAPLEMPYIYFFLFFQVQYTHLQLELEVLPHAFKEQEAYPQGSSIKVESLYTE